MPRRKVSPPLDSHPGTEGRGDRAVGDGARLAPLESLGGREGLAERSRHARVVAGHDDAAIDQLKDALLDLAVGLKVPLLIPLPNPFTGGRQYALRSVLLDGVPYEELWVYVRPPNPGAIKFIVENNLGRAGTRDLEAPDPIIQLLTAIPTATELRSVALGEDGGFASLDDDPFPVGEVADPKVYDFADDLGAIPDLDVELSREDL